MTYLCFYANMYVDDKKIINKRRNEMNRNELNKMLEITKRIGLTNQGEMMDFWQREKEGQETFLQTLERYAIELGLNFEIKGI